MFFPFHDDNPTRRTPVVTYALIAANVLALLWMGRLPDDRQQLVAFRYGFVPALLSQTASRDPRPVPVTIQQEAINRLTGQPVLVQREIQLTPDRRSVLMSLFTCMFLHAGWLHLLGNMWFLWIFGNNVEDRLGGFLYLFLYLFGGLLATASHWWMDPASRIPVVGASGAVAAVLGAYAITWPWARVHTLVVLIVFVTIIDVPALIVLGAWFVYQLVMGQAALRALENRAEAVAGGVAWWAHVGGFVAGLLLMPVLTALVDFVDRASRRRQAPENPG